MKKYRFDASTLSGLFQVAQRAPASSYAHTVGSAATKAAYLQNEYEKALVEVWAQKALQIIADAGLHLKKNTTARVVQFIWPDSSTGEFEAKYYTDTEWDYRTISEERGKIMHAVRSNAVKLHEVQDQQETQDTLTKGFEKLIPATAKKKMTIEVDIRSDGSLRVGLVPLVREGAGWLKKAKLAVYSHYPEDASSSTILQIDNKGKASLVELNIEANERVYILDVANVIQENYLKEDMKVYVKNFDSKMEQFKKKYYADVRKRMKAQQVEVPSPKPRPRTDSERRLAVEKMERARLARRERLATTLKGKEAISLLPFLGHGYASSRRWGIEIESGGARGVQAPRGWSRKRDGSLRSAWEGYVEQGEGTRTERYVVSHIDESECPSGENHEPELYTVERGYHRNPQAPGRNGNPECNQCGDIFGEREVPNVVRHRAQDDDCAEFVSPILGSMHSAGLEAILTPISQQPQNDTSGVHVHVEATDLTPKQLGSLVYGYDAIEGLIETSYRRNVREYCRLRATDSMFRILTDLKEKTVANTDKGDRYVTLNLQSLNRHGTVEFRAMGPVYDYDYLVRWAMFCREMVNIAKAGVTAKEWNSVNSWADLTALFAKYGKEYIRTVIDSLGGEVPVSPRLDTHDGTVSMPSGGETTPKIVETGLSFAEFAATMDEVAVNSRWNTTVESSLAAIGTGSQRVLVGALASGETEV